MKLRALNPIPPGAAGEAVRTEKLIASIKIFLCGLAILVTMTYFVQLLEQLRWSLVVTLGIFGLWLIGNLLIRVLLKRNESGAMVSALASFAAIVAVNSVGVVSRE